MPTNDPQPGERWIVRLIPGGTREAEVLLRATPHDMVSMPGMVVVFRYVSDRERAWTMTLRNFCGMFDWIPNYEPQPFAPVKPIERDPERPPDKPPTGAELEAPDGGDPYRYSRLMERWQRGIARPDGGRDTETLDEQTAAALWAAKEASRGRPV